MKATLIKLSLLTAVLLLPFCSHAQIIGDGIYSLNSELEKLFNDMIPLCRRMIDIGRAIAGFAALWYIALRVWKHIARAESIDFFPLLRPFAIGMAITFFPAVIALMNGVLKPLEVGTRQLSNDSYAAIIFHLGDKEKEVTATPPPGIYPGSGEDTEKYERPDGAGDEGGFFSGLKSAFNWFFLKSMFKIFISEMLNILYAAAALCINTIRTFYLIVLVIIGPIVFGLSVFDGFQNSLTSWFARYIHVYLWLPVANIFGGICSKILENMLNMDQNFASTTAYLVFMVISIVGYTTVPNVAGYIIQAGGKDTLLHKVNQMTQKAAKAAAMALV